MEEEGEEEEDEDEYEDEEKEEDILCRSSAWSQSPLPSASRVRNASKAPAPGRATQLLTGYSS